MAFADKLNIAISVVANVAVLAVSVIAIVISLEAYWDARSSGVEQSEALTKQVNTLTDLTKTAKKEREALDKSVRLAGDSLNMLSGARTEQAALLKSANNSLRDVVGSAQQEQKVATRSLGIARQQVGLATQERDVLKNELAITREQDARQQASRTNMPLLRFSLTSKFGEIRENRPLEIDSAKNFQVKVNIKNIGKSNLRSPVVLVGSTSEGVVIVGGTPSGNASQFNFNVDIANTGHPYQAPFEVFAGNATKFDLTINVQGYNDGGAAFFQSDLFNAIVLQSAR